MQVSNDESRDTLEEGGASSSAHNVQNLRHNNTITRDRAEVESGGSDITQEIHSRLSVLRGNVPPAAEPRSAPLSRKAKLKNLIGFRDLVSLRQQWRQIACCVLIGSTLVYMDCLSQVYLQLYHSDPTIKRLPDRGFDLLPKWNNPDAAGILLGIFIVITWTRFAVFTGPYALRWTIVRRWFLCMGMLFLLRGMSIICTVLPNPDETCTTTVGCDETMIGIGTNYRGCQDVTTSGNQCLEWSTVPKLPFNPPLRDKNFCRNYDGDIGLYCYTGGEGKGGYKKEPCTALPMRNIFFLALTVATGFKVTCADVLYSGHTVNFTLAALIWYDYSRLCPLWPEKEYGVFDKIPFNRIFAICWTCAGYFVIIATHFHYTVDVWIGFWMTYFVWSYYHEAIKVSPFHSTPLMRFLTWIEHHATDLRYWRIRVANQLAYDEELRRVDPREALHSINYPHPAMMNENGDIVTANGPAPPRMPGTSTNDTLNITSGTFRQDATTSLLQEGRERKNNQ